MSWGIGLTVALIVLGIAFSFPIGWVFLFGTLYGLLFMGENLNFVAGTFFYSIFQNWVMLGAAFFIFAGGLIAGSGLADRIVRFSDVLVGRMKGGLVAVGIVASLIMGAITGGALTSISALIPILVPRLEEYGYRKRYSTAVICASSYLGYLIPPSIPAMLYCMVSAQSVAAVFLATVFPGILLALFYGIINYIVCDRYMTSAYRLRKEAEASKVAVDRAREIRSATWSALPALGAPLVIFVGIYGGIFTPNEAGAVAAAYTFLVGLFVYRELTKRAFFDAARSAVLSMGMIALLLGSGTVFARLMAREGVAQALALQVMTLFKNRYLILLVMNLFLILLGMVMDGTPIMVLAIPLLLPLVKDMNMNLVHFGAIAVINIGMGMCTPPYAVSLFVGARISGVPYKELIRPILPFLFFASLPVLFLTVYFPFLSCWLPEVVLGPQFVGPWR